MTCETVLAFDFGEKRIGVAVGNDLLRVAQPLGTIDSQRSDARFGRIAELIEEWQPQRLVVGIPSGGDELEVSAGEESRRQLIGDPSGAQNASQPPGRRSMRQRCERFANQLHGRFRLPVERVDERYSSRDADDVHRTRRTSRLAGRARAIDHLAAQIILQRYFDESPALAAAASEPGRASANTANSGGRPADV